MQPSEYLKLPYTRRAIPDGDGFLAEIVEFPGCYTWEPTEQGALARLEDVAESWLLSCIARGHDIPVPAKTQ